MGTRNRYSIAARFNLLTISLIVLTSLGMTVYFLRSEMKKSHDELVRREMITANMLAQNSEYAVFTEDRKALGNLLWSIETDPDIVYAVFLDARGGVLLRHVKFSSIQVPHAFQERGPAPAGQTLYREFVNNGDGVRYLDLLTPVVSLSRDEFSGLFQPGEKRSNVIGYLQLGLTQEGLVTETRKYLLSSVIATSLFVLLGVGLTLLATRRIASPIRKLVSFAHSVSEENLDRRVEIDGSAEINALSNSFNQMLERLESSRNQVRERTEALAAANRKMESEIAERKHAEEMRDRLGMAVEQAAEAIVITDINGTILYVNPAFEQISGYAREEAVGKNPRILQSGRHDREYYREMWSTLTRGETWSGNILNRRKDGQLYEEVAIISPVRDESGKIVNYVGVKRDVTREVEMEEQLRQSQKMEAIGKLAGGIAHDFNNLLTAITGYTDILIGRLGPGDPGRTEVEEIQKAGNRAAALTRQLLAFSRKQILRPRVVDLNRVIGDMGKMLRQLIGEDIEFLTILSKDLWKVRVDPGQIEQVLMNLVVNARDAMQAEGRLIIETANVDLDDDCVREHPYVKAGPHAMIAVTDTGCGMSDETSSRIFEPFFTTKPQGKGTGLGLSTVYGIVKQSQGYIWVYSEVGKGTTFKVYLPRVEEQEGQSLEEPELVPKKWMGSETILLAEDEILVRDLVQTILRSHGYAVVEARDGVDALEVVRKFGGVIHLLLTDVGMPRMGGRELAMRIAPLRPGIRVLYMSGYTETAIVHEGELDVGTVFLQKPFRPEALLRKVREILDSSPGTTL